jgi:hypothetical protein
MLKDGHDLMKYGGLRFAYNSMVHNLFIASCMCSFLGSGFKVSLSLVSAKVTLLEPESTSLLSSIVLLHGLGQRLEDGSFGSLDWETGNGVLLDLSEGGSRKSRIVDQSLLWLILLSWEQDELGLVVGKSGDVKGFRLSTLVASSVINSNTDGSGESSGETGSLNLLKSKSSSELGFRRVLLGASMYDRSQQTKGSGRNGSSLLSSLLGSDLLMSVLVEEAFNAAHPVLSEMRAC